VVSLAGDGSYLFSVQSTLGAHPVGGRQRPYPGRLAFRAWLILVAWQPSGAG
jgi:hypothetical protein